MYDPIRIYHVNLKSVPWFAYVRPVWEDHADMNTCWTDCRSATGSSLSRELPDSSRESRCNVCIMHAPCTCYDIFRDGGGTLPALRAFRISDTGKLTSRRSLLHPRFRSSLLLWSPPRPRRLHIEITRRVSDLLPSCPFRVEGLTRPPSEILNIS